MKAVFLTENKSNIPYVYSEESINAVKESCQCTGEIFTKAQIRSNKDKFRDTEFIFSTWGMPSFSCEEIRECFPSLKAVFYAAGSVQHFARPFLQRNIKVFSAWAANAVPVAEFALAQILLANTGFFHKSALMSKGEAEKGRELPIRFPGNYEATVGIIGAGMVGRKLIELLKPFRVKTVVFDPFFSEERARELGTEKLSLEELFAISDVVSNHLANNEQTKGMLNYPLFGKMKPGAVFLNTGRGAQVVEADLVRVLKERKDLYALLDVTDPEPPEQGHPFYELENCILSPHLAGSKGNEVHRMADDMVEEFKNLRAGKPTRYEVTETMLLTMA